MSRRVLNLYRCALRVANQFPLDHMSRKLRYEIILYRTICFLRFCCAMRRYNIREMFEVHRYEADAQKIDQLVSVGWKNVETLKKLSKWDSETWKFGMQI